MGPGEISQEKLTQRKKWLVGEAKKIPGLVDDLERRARTYLRPDEENTQRTLTIPMAISARSTERKLHVLERIRDLVLQWLMEGHARSKGTGIVLAAATSSIAHIHGTGGLEKASVRHGRVFAKADRDALTSHELTSDLHIFDQPRRHLRTNHAKNSFDLKLL